jgi:carbamoyltransferase
VKICILGISAFYHDSAAALIVNGEIVAAAQEERFTRKKHDSGFPTNSVKYCIDASGIDPDEIDHVVFYEKPLVKFERLLETYLGTAPRGFRSFMMAMPVWLKEKLFLKRTLKLELEKLKFTGLKEKLLFTEHHQSHAASAFFPSPFDKAVVICLDGVGEWATTSVWLGDGNKLIPQWEIDFPHSLGLLYSAFTYYCGFKVNSGEYKLMGLAPYGEPNYVDQIKGHLVDIKEDGTYKLDMNFFDFATGLRMTNKKFDRIFGSPARKSESELRQFHMDLAKSIQVVTEEIVLKISRTVRSELRVENVCLAGGVALNCVANGKLYQEKIFKNIWIQPAAGDSGGALGAALSVWYEMLDNQRKVTGKDFMSGSYLGPSYTNEEISNYLKSEDAPFEQLSDDNLYKKLAEILDQKKVLGWFQGRMEFGPRALGARSIIGDPRSIKMQSIMNLKIKYRESFRPFAPAVLAEKVSEWFEYEGESPYMLMVAPVAKEKIVPMNEEQSKLFGIEKLNVPRSEIPAITHVDYSARLQTIHKDTNPRFHNLATSFFEHTGCPVLINTSFNVRGEPIVMTPEDAYRCFLRTEMDYLVLENCILDKKKQPFREDDLSWKKEFELD